MKNELLNQEKDNIWLDLIDRVVTVVTTLLIILLAFGVLVVFVFDINCLFKTIFDFPCPGCGLTRGFRQLFQGNFGKF